MIMRFNPAPTKLQDTLTRLRRNSIVLEAIDNVGLDLTSSAIRVTDFQVAESGKSLETGVTLKFEKDRAAVFTSVNPALLGILGYAPAVQSVISAGSWPAAGDVISVGLSDKLTATQVTAVQKLDYLLDLHIVPVGLP
jgi:hypothetical protein